MINEKIYTSYLSSLLSGNKKECTYITRELLDQNISIYDLYINLFQRSMYQIGKLWETNKISVAVEHMATLIIEGLLNLLYPQIFSAEHIGKSAIVSCVPNEFHQLGAKMVADIFELNGWDGFFLGANTPSIELLQLIDEKKPDLLALSMSIYFNLPALKETIQKVQTNYPQLDIIVGGQGLLECGKDIVSEYSDVSYVDSLIKLEQLIRKISS